MRRKLMQYFVRENQAKFSEIVKALGEDNIKLAYRLALTLKGNAGQLGETRLQQAAETVARLLEGEKNLARPEHLSVLENALNAALETLVQRLDKDAPPPLPPTRTPPSDAKKARELIKKLQPLLAGGNPECLALIDELRTLPGSESLIRQMEDFDFDQASATLAEIHTEWVRGDECDREGQPVHCG
jgi:HPt (histidine-containing phosphotransfer) domain-containing protein